MKTLLAFACLVASSYAHILPENSDPSRIVNGVDVGVGEIPYQVSLQQKGNSFHFCGGSILNKKYVITAAHCVKGTSAASIKVVSATVKLSEPVTTHLVEKIIVHEKYDASDSWKNDIALLRVKGNFVVSSTLNFVPMPSPGMAVPADSPAIVSGWGNLRQGGPSPNHLQKAKILIADQKYCKKRYAPGNTVHDTHICAHDPVEETGSCNGDSGGPLTVRGKLVGLVSWAMGCAMTNYPTVYTRVPEFLDWIQEHAV
ncbi:chymotrypsin-2-like [Diachasmimorpha longicaudata]|uniref:chymotrypsin-2-like n=1 Tax=Diachasmimorpha longicaudata TaxID=58733 RepID=UPI0030B8AE9D